MKQLFSGAEERVKEPPPTSNNSSHRLVVLQNKPSNSSNPTSQWLKLLSSPSCPDLIHIPISSLPETHTSHAKRL